MPQPRKHRRSYLEVFDEWDLRHEASECPWVGDATERRNLRAQVSHSELGVSIDVADERLDHPPLAFASGMDLACPRRHLPLSGRKGRLLRVCLVRRRQQRGIKPRLEEQGGRSRIGIRCFVTEVGERDLKLQTTGGHGKE